LIRSGEWERIMSLPVVELGREIPPLKTVSIQDEDPSPYPKESGEVR
jgi:hypothetical protein